jgi:nickel-dependent lactate racemase
VVVPDATRATFVRAMVGGVTEYLAAAGLEGDDVQILIAGGLHRPPTVSELAQLLGPAAGRFPITVHDADDPALVTSSPTRRRTPVLLSRHLHEAGTVVLLGGITPHYFAGWTGGLKGIVPGAAGRVTVTANHRLAVDASRPGGLHPGCREGNLRGNPVAADFVEAASRAPAPFLVNVVLGREGEPRAVVTGTAREAHAAGVALARRAIGVALRRYPVVLVAAGHPGRERDWIQAHKFIRQGARCVRDGGTLVALAACADGIGSATLLDWFDLPPATLPAAVAARYTLHAHTALAIRALTRRIRVVLVSDLAPPLVERMGLVPAGSLGEALATAAAGTRTRSPSGAARAAARALAIPRAGSLLPLAAGSR